MPFYRAAFVFKTRVFRWRQICHWITKYANVTRFGLMATNLVPRALFPAFGGWRWGGPPPKPGKSALDIKPGYNVLVLSGFFSASVSLLLFKSSKYAFVRRVSVKRRAGVGAEAGSILFLRHAVLGLGLVSTLTLTLALKHTSLKKKRWPWPRVLLTPFLE